MGLRVPEIIINCPFQMTAFISNVIIRFSSFNSLKLIGHSMLLPEIMYGTCRCFLLE